MSKKYLLEFPRQELIRLTEQEFLKSVRQALKEYTKEATDALKTLLKCPQLTEEQRKRIKEHQSTILKEVKELEKQALKAFYEVKASNWN